MRKKLFNLSILMCLTCFVNAQQDNQPCGTKFPEQEWENEFQKLISDFASNQSNIKSAFVVYTIPVIFHVVHGGEPINNFPNIAQGQLNSQLTVLNQDFSGNAYNVGNYPANAFVNWAINQALPLANKDINGRVKIANFDIQFCLATQDTLGNTLSEPGINRINYITKGWQNPNTFSTQTTFKNYLDSIIKPQSIWNVKKYLNVWVTDKSNLLTYGGVSSVPPFSTLPGIPNTATDSTDGIWCYTKSIGSYSLFPSGQYVSTNIDGRTLTHEVGHYLGLRHIWGDATCGNDYCADTPPASAQNSSSPTYPHNVGSCSSPSNNPDGEMFMNFMDYSMGPSKYMFTVDQMIRAQTAMLNSPFRNQLGTHGLCSTTGLNEFNNTNNLIIYPNPTSSAVHINITGQKLESIKIYYQTGELIQEYFSTDFSVSNLPDGIYFIITQTNKSIFTNKLIKQ